MDNNTFDQDAAFAFWATYGVLAVAVLVLVWVGLALAAWAVAPEDRPWHFFWCTLLFLGPIGVVAALVAQPRQAEG